MTTHLKLQPSLVYQVSMRNIPYIMVYSHMPWKFDNYFVSHVQYINFSESFTSIPKYVYLSYTKMLKHSYECKLVFTSLISAGEYILLDKFIYLCHLKIIPSF